MVTAGNKTNKRAVGRSGEDAAHKYLADRGYKILYRNFRYGRYGEIDIIAINCKVVCFIEVKSRAGDAFGTPAESVGYAKRKNIISVAGHFLRTFDFREYRLRFDVIEVYYEKPCSGNAPRIVKNINHIENAFQET